MDKRREDISLQIFLENANTKISLGFWIRV